MNETDTVLSMPSWVVPFYISLRDRGSQSDKQLQAATGKSLATVYRAIATLRELGLVSKQHGSHAVIVKPHERKPMTPRPSAELSFPVIFQHNYFEAA